MREKRPIGLRWYAPCIPREPRQGDQTDSDKVFIFKVPPKEIRDVLGYTECRQCSRRVLDNVYTRNERPIPLELDTLEKIESEYQGAIEAEEWMQSHFNYCDERPTERPLSEQKKEHRDRTPFGGEVDTPF